MRAMSSAAASRLVAAARLIAFDLDGTLVDTAPDLALAVNQTLALLGATPLAAERIPAMVGHGVEHLLATALAAAFGAPPTQRALALAAPLFAQLYQQRVLFKSRVYDGVPETLQRLAADGKALGCITNKAGRYAQPLLTAAGLSAQLAFISSPATPAQRKPAPSMLLEACARTGVQPRELLYVGDSPIDIAAARAAGSPVISVDYGFSPLADLIAAAPDAIIGNFSELTRHL